MSTYYVADGARIVGGRVDISDDCGIWYNAVIRGDDNNISIGKRTNIQDNCVVHVGAKYPVSIGEGVTIGHSAIVHGCKIGDNTLIGMGAIVLNGAVVGKNCIIGAGALVTQGTVIPDGSMAFGSPARVVRQLKEEELASNRNAAEKYVGLAKESLQAVTV